MPHVIVKLYAGRTSEDKARIADAVTRALIESAGSSEASVSVAIEDVDPAAWAEQVYRPEIADRWDSLYKRPGYNPLA